MYSRLLTRKLGYLRRHLVEEASGIGTLVVTSLLEDPDSLCIVQECRDLEEYGTKLTTKILANADAVIMADVRKEIRKRDKETHLERCAVKKRCSEEGRVLACTMRCVTPSRITTYCWPSALNENSSPPWERA